MYNKVVATLAILIVVSMLGGTAHAQYYTRTYSSAYGSSFLGVGSSYASANYFGEFQGPAFTAPQRTPSNFNVAYMAQPIQAPVLQPVQYSPSSYNFQFAPTTFQPTYGSGPGFGNLNLNIAPHFTPTYGQGLNLGSFGFTLPYRQFDLGNRFSLGPYGYNFRSYAVPIYATPSRALFNTEFHYRSFIGSNWY